MMPRFEAVSDISEHVIRDSLYYFKKLKSPLEYDEDEDEEDDDDDSEEDDDDDESDDEEEEDED